MSPERVQVASTSPLRWRGHPHVTEEGGGGSPISLKKVVGAMLISLKQVGVAPPSCIVLYHDAIQAIIKEDTSLQCINHTIAWYV